MDTEQTCHVCQSSKFFEENGNYWCMECNTMSQQITAVMVDQSGPVPAEVLEDLDITDESGPENRGSDKLLTTFELLTKVLRGLALELIEIGVSPELYKVSKVMWLSYLQKCGLILNKHKQPVLPAMFAERDVEILYGVQGVSRKKIITGSSRKSKKVKTKSTEALSDRRKQKNIMQQLILEEEGNEHALQCIQEPWSDSSRNSSAYETDEEIIKDIKLVKGSEKFIKKSRRYYAQQDTKRKPLIRSVNAESSIESKKMHIGAVDVLAVLWLAIQYTSSSHLQLSDLYRLVTDGYLNLDNLERFVPKQYRNYQCFRYFFKSLSRKSFVLRCGSTCNVLGMTHIKTCDIRVLIKRYVKELALPDDILPYTDIICALSSPSSFSLLLPMDRLLPEYDLIAMAVILVTLKALLGLDDATEVELSSVARDINEIQTPSARAQFDYSAWWEYIECRNASIAAVHNVSFEKTYTRLMSHKLAARSFLAKGGVCRERTVKKHLLGGSKRTQSIIRSGLETLRKELENNSETEELEAPLKPPLALRADEAYLPAWNEMILNQTTDSTIDPKVREILETDFTQSSLDYLNPTKFSELCAQRNLPFELHKGRSPRSPVDNRINISVFLPGIPGNIFTPKVQAHLNRAPRKIQEEIDKIDEMIALWEIEDKIFRNANEDSGKQSGQNKKSPKKKRKTKTASENEPKLTLYVPWCQYWVIHHPNLLSLHGSRYKYLYKPRGQTSRAVLTLCPVNFIALLNLCANIVRSEPYHMYASVCLLETSLVKSSDVKVKRKEVKAKFWHMKDKSKKGDKDEVDNDDEEDVDGGFESM
ncbi:hypothetical protein WDU94_008030 [Cyamophila willieti]